MAALESELRKAVTERDEAMTAHLEATTRASEAEAGTPALPVIILTADEQAPTRENALARGANGFLSKPLEPAKLLDLIDSLPAEASVLSN